MLLTLSAPVADAWQTGAQQSGLAAKLKAGVSCVEADAGAQLLHNTDGGGFALADILSALDELSIDPTACIQIRDAASALAQQLNHDNPALDATEVAVANDRMQEILAEADQRAASMRFEVGPPPRNLTRSRAAHP